MASYIGSLIGAWYRRHWLVLESLVLGAVLLAVYFAQVERVGMHIDENHWIVTSNAWEPFARGDRSADVWAESYLTLTAPPATRYVVGIGRSLGGYGSHELVTPWAFEASAEQNAAAGAIPSDDLLWWSRLPMVVLASLACLASFWLMRSLFGASSAYVGLALLAFSPWLRDNLVRAMAEAPLLCSLLLVVTAATRLANVAYHNASLRAQLLWLFVAGFGAGLAGSFKLSGLTALAGIAVVWICVVVGRPRWPLQLRVALIVLGIAFATAVAAVTLVALNPYLDPDPLLRFTKLVQFRSEEMRAQLLIRSWWPIRGIGDRAQFIFINLFQQAVMVHHPAAGVVSLALWLVGLGAVVRRVYAAARQRVLDPAGAALLVALTAAGPMLATPLRWDRYLFLPVWFSALLIALGTTVCVRALVGAVGRRTGARLAETPGWSQTRPES